MQRSGRQGTYRELSSQCWSRPSVTRQGLSCKSTDNDVGEIHIEYYRMIVFKQLKKKGCPAVIDSKKAPVRKREEKLSRQANLNSLK
jgi:hypothetical protein